MRKVYETTSVEETIEVGRQIASDALPGQIYALIGDLGVGKTAFSEGFASGLGISGPVTSPTFTILMEYDEGRLPLYHYDVYRIGDISELDEIGFEEYLFGEGVTLIEWADLILEYLPKERMTVRIEKDLDRGYDFRYIYVDSEE